MAPATRCVKSCTAKEAPGCHTAAETLLPKHPRRRALRPCTRCKRLRVRGAPCGRSATRTGSPAALGALAQPYTPQAGRKSQRRRQPRKRVETQLALCHHGSRGVEAAWRAQQTAQPRRVRAAGGARAAMQRRRGALRLTCGAALGAARRARLRGVRRRGVRPHACATRALYNCYPPGRTTTRPTTRADEARITQACIAWPPAQSRGALPRQRCGAAPPPSAATSGKPKTRRNRTAACVAERSVLRQARRAGSGGITLQRLRRTCAAAAPVSHTHTTARDRPPSSSPARTAAESCGSGMRNVLAAAAEEPAAAAARLSSSPVPSDTSTTSGGVAEATMAASSAAVTSLRSAGAVQAAHCNCGVVLRRGGQKARAGGARLKPCAGE